MTLLELIAGLKTNNVKVTVIDAESSNELITFFSQGISAVENDLTSSAVRRWELTGASSLSVVVESTP